MQAEIGTQGSEPLRVERIGGTVVIASGEWRAELSERQAQELAEAIHAEES